MFKNLLATFSHYRVATVVNLLGLSFAFFAFILICIHVHGEYGYDGQIPDSEQIYQVENLRDDAIWDANWARPTIETLLANSPQVEAYGLSSSLAYGLGVTNSLSEDIPGYIETICRITPQYTQVFGFELVSGDFACLDTPTGTLISESMANKFFGNEDPIGRPLYISEFKGVPSQLLQSAYLPESIDLTAPFIIGGVFKDFPENTRVENAIYLPILPNEQIDDWSTGSYYCFAKFKSYQEGEQMLEQFVANNKELLDRVAIKDLRIRPIKDLYFGEQARSDSALTGNRLRTDILLFIAILIIGIALVNYVNFSVALAPVRAKSITLRKVLGGTQAALRKNLLLESMVVTFLAYLLAIGLFFLVRKEPLLISLVGHPLTLAGNQTVFIWSFVAALLGSLMAGIYPAWYITSFPALMALNGTFALSYRAKFIRKGLLVFQFAISISLIVASLFVMIQNRFIENAALGFDKENVLEVKMSLGTGLTQSEAFCNQVKNLSGVKDISICQYQFITDQTRSLIGYNMDDHHSYMSWFGVSFNFPEMMGINIIEGRNFRESDQYENNPRAVCLINTTAAKEIRSWFSPEEVPDMAALVGKYIYDNSTPVEIIGIMEDVHYESLYKSIRPLAVWTANRSQYRPMFPGNYAYVKVATADAASIMSQIRDIAQELNPGYPIDISFVDDSLNILYQKSFNQGLLIAILSLLAVLLSLVGVFGLVIFQTKGMEKEIKVRKVFGASILDVLRLINKPYVVIILISAFVAIPLSYIGVSIWLRGFAYRTPLYAWVAVVALLIITILTFLTVTLQSYRSAKRS